MLYWPCAQPKVLVVASATENDDAPIQSESASVSWPLALMLTRCCPVTTRRGACDVYNAVLCSELMLHQWLRSHYT
jgi:hypothetical protein